MKGISVPNLHAGLHSCECNPPGSHLGRYTPALYGSSYSPPPLTYVPESGDPCQPRVDVPVCAADKKKLLECNYGHWMPRDCDDPPGCRVARESWDQALKEDHLVALNPPANPGPVWRLKCDSRIVCARQDGTYTRKCDEAPRPLRVEFSEGWHIRTWCAIDGFNLAPCPSDDLQVVGPGGQYRSFRNALAEGLVKVTPR